MALARPPGPGSGWRLHGSVLKNPLVFVSVPLQFSFTVVVTEKPCAEAHPHQAMIKAAAPDAAARIQLSYKRTMFIFASRFATKHASSHWGELTAKQSVSYKVASS